VPLCPQQTPHAARTRTRAAAVGSQRLTAELRHGLGDTNSEIINFALPRVDSGSNLVMCPLYPPREMHCGP
jgi:hypothetical protein